MRVKAHALRQILDTTDNVLVMGHKLADIDSFGSAIGIYTICRKLGKNVHIVINEVTSSVKPFMKRFIGKDEYPEDLFLLKEEAPEYVDAATVVIVVDVNKPQLTECPELLDKCKTIVVFDHHRQSSDQITGAVLSYVDPYASSASEMITEMIQYVDDNIKIKAFEADALYAGINIDTDGFNSKSGPRTFEAAAFLRRHGADVTRVRKMLRNDMDEYKAVAHAVSRAEVYRDAFAIAQARLGQDFNSTDEQDWIKAAELLAEQKDKVNPVYVMDEVFNLMESGEYAFATYYAGDYVLMNENNEDLGFCIPKEDVNSFYDAFCIPKCSKNKKAGEAFINFMHEPEVALANSEYIYYRSANYTVEQNKKSSLYGNPAIYSNAKNIQYFKNLPQNTTELENRLWTEVKSGQLSVNSKKQDKKIYITNIQGK